MKKGLLFFLMLAGTFFTACEDKQDSPKEERSETLTIITPNFDKSIRGPIIKEAKEFEQKTGSMIRIVSPSFEEIPEKIKESLNDDKINYDIFLTSAWGASVLYNEVCEVPDWVKEEIEWGDVLPVYKNNVLSWNKKYYFLPYDGDSLNLYYRKDLFENKEYREKFKKEFGYELDVPKTWKEYNDIAKFFTGWDWDNDGRIEYGFAESRIKGFGTTLLFLTKAAAYAKYPADKGYYFDPYTMKPRINNPGFVKALQEFVDIMKYAPEEIMNFTPLDVRYSFITGDAALIIDWPDAGPMAQNTKGTLIKGKAGFAELPGSNRVYNSNKKQWENIYNAPSSIIGTWTIAVNKNSKNIKLAFDFASHMTSKKITSKYVVQGWSGVNPSRYSHLMLNGNIAQWEKNGFTKDLAKEYLNAISNSLLNENVVTDLRIPGTDLYYKALEKYIDKAVKKELSPKQALDTAAKEWNKITKRLGKEKQLKLYRESINE